MATIEYVGVDGCPCGWFSVGFSATGEYELRAFLEFRDLLTHFRRARLILVDIPIGLMAGDESRGQRPCDTEARRRLTRTRRSSVFRPPARETVQLLAGNPGTSDQDLQDIEHETSQKLLSSQALGIIHQIADVHVALRDSENEDGPDVREIHPELCFWALGGENPAAHSKKEEEGIQERLRLLQNAENRSADIFREARRRFFRRPVREHDILDALAAAVTAYAYRDRAHDDLQRLPENDAQALLTRDGIPMEMVYWIPGN